MFKKIIYASEKIIKKLLIAIIKFYQIALSPFLANRCRFYPSCSHYAKEAIETKGILRGIYLTVRRLLRCHPYNPGGYDPVPNNAEK